MLCKLAVFDLDGTILNTLEDLADSLNAALKASGFPGRTLEEVRCFVGNGIRKLIERGVPAGASEEEIVRVHETFTAHYKVHCADKTRPYPGIETLLKDLRKAGCKTAVVSNKADYAVQELCEQYFPGVFDAAVGERAGILKKPAPDSVNEVLRRLNVTKENAVYIGDSEVDIATARNAQMRSILVDWGFRDRSCLVEQGAETIVSSPEEIEKLLIGPAR